MFLNVLSILHVTLLICILCHIMILYVIVYFQFNLFPKLCLHLRDSYLCSINVAMTVAPRIGDRVAFCTLCLENQCF